MLLGEKPRKVLEYIHDNGIAVKVSFMSQGLWLIRRAAITSLTNENFEITVWPEDPDDVIELGNGRNVGITYIDEVGDRFLFAAQVASTSINMDNLSDKNYILDFPEEIEVIRKSGYISVNISNSLDVPVNITHRDFPGSGNSTVRAQVLHGFSGRLTNLSVDTLGMEISAQQGPDFEKGQYVQIKFTPMANETDISLNAYVGNSIKTNSGDIYIELQITGLETSVEGQMVIRRLCNIISRYRKLSQEDIAAPESQKQPLAPELGIR